MNKIQLVVTGIHANPASNSAYALFLKELEGSRKLPIIIGAFEAQAIALELEGVQPPRPMTHDLLRTLIESFNSSLSEVFINDLRDGTFYAKLIFETEGIEIDARPSDAIAVAVRCNTPIYINEDILEEAAIAPQDNVPDESTQDAGIGFPPVDETKKPVSKVEALQQQLEKAIQNEDYEKAAKLRDELKRILESS